MTWLRFGNPNGSKTSAHPKLSQIRWLRFSESLHHEANPQPGVPYYHHCELGLHCAEQEVEPPRPPPGSP